ncbi:hypothetical protein GCM10011585_07130 [Edaphobacter dinghuensis]|uniref:Uncharacterized protein n=1 Tax=Edaphobacter dinghuensis TaxID=1560005 RepID=A0A917H505_9BACT|nr:hypothetical protein GCM10011585_07130 [Edaphobacter dinghuensis]
MRGREREGEQFGAAGFAQLAEITRCTASGEPRYTARPDGAPLESGIHHRKTKTVGCVAGFDSGKRVVGAGEQKSTTPKALKADVGDLTCKRLPVGVRKMRREIFCKDLGFVTAE